MTMQSLNHQTVNVIWFLKKKEKQKAATICAASHLLKMDRQRLRMCLPTIRGGSEVKRTF